MKFITEPNQLTIQLQGAEQLWALKRRLRVPLSAIADIDYLARQPALTDLKGYIRFPGTALPWVFLAGSYRRRGEREFWYLKMKTPGVMTIYLKGDAIAYDKIRLTCQPEVAQRLADWWQSGRRQG